MTVREVPSAPPPRRGGGTLSPCTIFSEIFNILQQQKSGEPQLPAFFLCATFSAVFMAAVFGSPPLLQFFPQYVKLLWIKAVQISHIVV